MDETFNPPSVGELAAQGAKMREERLKRYGEDAARRLAEAEKMAKRAAAVSGS